jgi:rubrerythrin
MAVIAFSKKPENTCVVAGWAFRQVLDDTVSQHPEDSEMAREFEEAKYIPGLNLYLLEPEFANRITQAIRQAIMGILSGEIQSGIVKQPHGDKLTIEQYHDGLRELLRAIPTEC